MVGYGWSTVGYVGQRPLTDRSVLTDHLTDCLTNHLTDHLTDRLITEIYYGMIIFHIFSIILAFND